MNAAFRFDDALAVARLWLRAGGSNSIELGALEPLLWRDGKHHIAELVAALVDLGYEVSMTTNGSILEKHVDSLSSAKLHLLRISWHTTNSDLFRELSGGHGDYTKFYRGISAAAESGMAISFNRVLLRGYTSDLDEQLDFIDRYRLRLKLYSLLLTPAIAEVYNRMFVDWHDVIANTVMPRTIRIENIDKDLGRSRTRYLLPSGGYVEVKRGDRVNRSKAPCSTCAFKQGCLEEFGDYARIDPQLNFYSCYMRRDIGFNLRDCISQGSSALHFRALIQSILGGDCSVDTFLSNASLRLTVTPHCNFNCRVPGTEHSWCMEAPGDFTYPRILPSMFKL